MPLPRDISSSLQGAWRLMRFDAGGMGGFDLSADGFWRSFLAAIPVAPTYAIVVWLELATREEPFNAAWAVMVCSIAYGLGWVAFPVAAIGVTRLLGLTDRYVALIVSFNWISVPQALIMTLVIALDASGGLPGPLGGWLTVAAMVYILIYQWFVARVALDTTPLTTTGVVVLQVVISLFIEVSLLRLI